VDNYNSVIFGSVIITYFAATIGRAIVDKYQFKIGESLSKNAMARVKMAATIPIFSTRDVILI